MGHSAEIAPWLVSVIGGGIAGGVEAAVTVRTFSLVQLQVELTPNPRTHNADPA